MWNTIQAGLGLQAETLSAGQIACRAVVVYGILLALVRLVGDRRSSGKHSAIDVILSIILGATLSRAINGSVHFGGTLLSGVILVGLHWLLAALAFHVPRLEKLLKGRARPLVEDGALNQTALRRSHITHHDLLSTLRLAGQPGDLSQVSQATLETNGDISIISDRHIQAIEVSVESGVQTIRIQLEQ